ncbi:MAG: CDP-alcohol phosphatidyltransferase family protein [Candidatus Dormibacteraeota bacterium]|nr:CDP-alcohol phosphatidyltransferase family protein [Candidatus Dormibacteraeota bacterium]
MSPARIIAAVAGVLYLGGGVAWAWLAVPRALPFVVPWFAVLAVAGVWLPGLANQVTLSRAYLAAPALVYALTPGTLLPLAGVVTLAGITDVVDGTIARRLEQPTRLGGGLDPVVDGLFFGALAVGLAAGQAYPLWLAALVLVRYGLPALVGAALLLLGRRPKLQHTPLGQASTLLIGVLLGGVALLRGLGQPVDLLLAVTEVVVPAAVLATFVNLYWANRAVFQR